MFPYTPLSIEIPGGNFNPLKGSDSGFIMSDNTVLIATLPFLFWFVVRIVIRRWFRDGSEIAKDRAETDILTVLRTDNKDLRKSLDEALNREQKMAEERNEALSQMGRFLAESKSNKTKISELQASMESMSRKLEEQSVLLNELLLENAQLKAQINLMGDLNDRFKSELDRLEALNR